MRRARKLSFNRKKAHMMFDLFLAGLVGAGLFVYLMIVLLQPERF
jgi:K+-transporting ATPase KdpF subunit